MTLYNEENDVDTVDADVISANMAELWSINIKNAIRQMQDRSIDFSADQTDLWAEAYVDSNGQGNSVDTGSSTAYYNSDIDVYEVPYKVIIDATSISSTGDFAINDCEIELVSSGVWSLKCTSGSRDTQRAKVIQTLFYGTDGSDPRATSTYITGLTSIQSNDSRDVGKYAYYAQRNAINGSGSGEYSWLNVDADSGTFDIEIWADLYVNAFIGVDVQAPDGTNIGTATQSMSKIGTSTSYTATSVSDCRAGFDGAGNEGHTNKAIFLTSAEGAPSTEGSVGSGSTIDFNDTHSVPAFTAISSVGSLEVHHNIPSGTFGSTISTAIGSSLVEDWEAGANIQYKLTNSGGDDSGWLETDEISEFTAFTAEPDTLIVKLIPKSSSPTSGYPSIKGFGVRAE